MCCHEYIIYIGKYRLPFQSITGCHEPHISARAQSRDRNHSNYLSTENRNEGLLSRLGVQQVTKRYLEGKGYQRKLLCLWPGEQRENIGTTTVLKPRTLTRGTCQLQLLSQGSEEGPMSGGSCISSMSPWRRHKTDHFLKRLFFSPYCFFSIFVVLSVLFHFVFVIKIALF